MKDLGYCLLLIFILGLLLVGLNTPMSEGFMSRPTRCDVNSPCPGHLKCINGFCAKTDPVGVVEKDEVPILSPGEPAPYF